MVHSNVAAPAEPILAKAVSGAFDESHPTGSNDYSAPPSNLSVGDHRKVTSAHPVEVVPKKRGTVNGVYQQTTVDRGQAGAGISIPDLEGVGPQTVFALSWNNTLLDTPFAEIFLRMTRTPLDEKVRSLLSIRHSWLLLNVCV